MIDQITKKETAGEPVSLDGQATIIIQADTREPRPHPWAMFWPDNVQVQRATMGTGDLCLFGNADICVERKTPGDLAACITEERERFMRELNQCGHEQPGRIFGHRVEYLQRSN